LDFFRPLEQPAAIAVTTVSQVLRRIAFVPPAPQRRTAPAMVAGTPNRRNSRRRAWVIPAAPGLA
jgi:hypothetical protein